MKLLSMPSLALCVLGCFGCGWSQWIKVESDVDASRSLDGIRELTVHSRNGSIQVRVVEGADSLRLRGRKFATGVTLEDAHANLEDVLVEIRPDPGKESALRVEVERVGDWRGSFGASLELTLSPEITLDLDTSNGKVEVAGVRRDVKIRTSNGTIHVGSVAADVDAKTSNGKIIVEDVDGDVEARTSNGGIVLEGVGRNRVEAETSNGSIRALRVRGNATLRSSNASIELRSARVPETPEITAVTSNGNVVVELPESVDASLRMATSNGRVAAEMRGATVRDLEQSKKALRATLNGGSGTIQIRSSNGSVTFRTTGDGGESL